jgi:xylan 1,4-beta-xylosidase
MYNGSSNRYPLYGIELNRKTMQPIGTRKELYLLEPWRYGWQRFGEHMDDTFLDPFMEGAWMTRYKDKYYLQYGAPGTEFSGYADGVVVGDTPLGPFTPQSMPFSLKPGGFANGAGHGATFQDRWDNYWHVSTISISVKNNFERRIGIWPAGFDKDGVMYCSQAFGDYPTFLPNKNEDHLQSNFTGWMLLNYNKPVSVSSTFGSYNANNAVDENIKTYWCAASGNKDEWIQTDLGAVSTVRAIQINYADQDADILGKGSGLYHQYKILESKDGKKWNLLTDKSTNNKDVPHDYIELSQPVQTRFLKLINLHVPSGKFAISGFRVFGNCDGAKPEKVKGFVVLRTQKDKRSAWLKWYPTDNAYAYNLYMGTSPDKLYNCIMVYGTNEYWLKTMDIEKPYYFAIEAINENGIGERSAVVKAE